MLGRNKKNIFALFGLYFETETSQRRSSQQKDAVFSLAKRRHSQQLFMTQSSKNYKFSFILLRMPPFRKRKNG